MAERSRALDYTSEAVGIGSNSIEDIFLFGMYHSDRSSWPAEVRIIKSSMSFYQSDSCIERKILFSKTAECLY